MNNVTTILKSMGVTMKTASSALSCKEPVAHPLNCKAECPYGKGRAFCFPCMNQIMSEHRAALKAGEA